MPVALKIPIQNDLPPLLRDGDYLPIRGVKNRRAALQKIETRQKVNEGILHTVLICTTLWSGFWFQFVVSAIFNFPAIYTLSSGNWYSPQVGCYIPSSGPLPYSIAGNFLLLSMIGALVAMVGGWHFTRRVAGCWRMRFAVLVFASLLVGWAMATMAAEPAAWQALEQERISIQKRLDSAANPDELPWSQYQPVDEQPWLRRQLKIINEELSKKPSINH